MRTIRAARRVAVALLLGAATEVVVIMIALLDPPRIVEASEVMLTRGTTAWHGHERASAMVRWTTMETVGPLVNPAADSGFVPRWSEPPPVADARLVRHAAFAVGWPVKAVACTWTTDRFDVNFPPPIENETSGDAPKEAARRMLAAIKHERAPAGGHGTSMVLASGLAFDAAALSLPWLAATMAAGALLRRRAVTRRG